MDSATQFQNLYEAVCISNSPNNVEKLLASLNMLWQPVLEKENFEFRPIIFYLEIDLVSFSAPSGEVR